MQKKAFVVAVVCLAGTPIFGQQSEEMVWDRIFSLEGPIHIGDENIGSWAPLSGSCVSIEFPATEKQASYKLTYEPYGLEAAYLVLDDGRRWELAAQTVNSGKRPNYWGEQAELRFDNPARNQKISGRLCAETIDQNDFDDFMLRNVVAWVGASGEKTGDSLPSDSLALSTGSSRNIAPERKTTEFRYNYGLSLYARETSDAAYESILNYCSVNFKKEFGKLDVVVGTYNLNDAKSEETIDWVCDISLTSLQQILSFEKNAKDSSFAWPYSGWRGALTGTNTTTVVENPIESVNSDVRYGCKDGLVGLANVSLKEFAHFNNFRRQIVYSTRFTKKNDTLPMLARYSGVFSNIGYTSSIKTIRDFAVVDWEKFTVAFSGVRLQHIPGSPMPTFYTINASEPISFRRNDGFFSGRLNVIEQLIGAHPSYNNIERSLGTISEEVTIEGYVAADGALIAGYIRDGYNYHNLKSFILKSDVGEC